MTNVDVGLYCKLTEANGIFGHLVVFVSTFFCVLIMDGDFTGRVGTLSWDLRPLLVSVVGHHTILLYTFMVVSLRFMCRFLIRRYR